MLTMQIKNRLDTKDASGKVVSGYMKNASGQTINLDVKLKRPRYNFDANSIVLEKGKYSYYGKNYECWKDIDPKTTLYTYDMKFSYPNGETKVIKSKGAYGQVEDICKGNVLKLVASNVLNDSQMEDTLRATNIEITLYKKK